MTLLRFGSTVLFTSLAVGTLSMSIAPTSAAAQTSTRVAVTDLEIDGSPPPEGYRPMLTQAIQPTIGEIERCYDTALRTRPTLGGALRLRLWVSGREVIRTTPETSVGDTTLETCTRTAVRAFHLPPEAPGGGVAVRFTVRFTAPPVPVATPSTTTEIAPTTPLPPVAPAARASVDVTRITNDRTGNTAVADITRVVEGCASDATSGMAAPFRVTFDTTGRATATLSRGTLTDATARRCLVREVARITRARANRSITVRGTLTFR